jgi:hypothetical protein
MLPMSSVFGMKCLSVPQCEGTLRACPTWVLSEPNPRPLFIIKNNFYLLSLAFTFLALTNLENIKYLYFFQVQPKTPKHLY